MTLPDAWSRDSRPLTTHPLARGVATGVVEHRRGATEWGVVRVEDVDVRLRRELRVDREAEQATVPEVVDVRPEIGELRRGRVRDGVEDLDDAALLGDEHAAVRRELDVRRIREPGEDDVLLEAARQRHCARARGEQQHGGDDAGKRQPKGRPPRPNSTPAGHAAGWPPPNPCSIVMRLTVDFSRGAAVSREAAAPRVPTRERRRGHEGYDPATCRSTSSPSFATGERVISERVPGVRSVALGFWIGAGSRDEPEARAGVSHFIEHLLFKGSSRYSAQEIAEIFDELGGELNAATSRETTVVYARIPDDRLERALDVMADMVFRPAFADVDSEREVVLEEIAMVEDTPNDLVHDIAAEAVFGAHPLGRPVIGRAEVISTVSRRALAGYHRRAYQPRENRARRRGERAP